MVEDIGEKKEQQLSDLRTNNEKLKEELQKIKSDSTSKLSTMSQRIQDLEEEKEDVQITKEILEVTYKERENDEKLRPMNIEATATNTKSKKYMRKEGGNMR